MRGARLGIQAFDGDVFLSIGDGASAGSLIGDDTSVEVLLAAGFLDVFDTDVEALHEDAVSDGLRYLNTDRGTGDVENTASTPLVEFVGHALHDGGVDPNIHIIPDLEHLQVGRGVLRTFLSERLLEQMASIRALSVGTNHLGECVAMRVEMEEEVGRRREWW